MIVVWFSCGVASAVAAKMTLSRYDNVRVVNTPVLEEDADNRRFLKDVEKWLHVPIETAIHSNHPNSSAEQIWKDGRFMSNRFGAECTRTLKKGARYQWEREHKPDWHVLGFTADEKHRFERFKAGERENAINVLGDAGITKEKCFEIIRDAGIKRPRLYDLGYPNANCIGCVKATSPTYWNHVRQVHPDIFKCRSDLSREIGCKLVRIKGVMRFLDELKVTDTGRPMKDMNIDCGVFCEEKS